MLRPFTVAFACLTLASASTFAEEPAPPPPPTPQPAPPPNDAPPASSTPPAPTSASPPSDDDTKKLLEEIQAEDKKAGASSSTPQEPAGVPDLSKVNIAAGIPGAASMNPSMSIILDAAGAAFGAARPSRPGSPLADKPLQTGGHDPTSNGFTLRQVELSFAANVDPFLRFDSNLVIKDTLEVEEAYATTLDLPWSLQARMGEFLSKFGRQNEQHPHAWWFVSQPLVYGQFMGEDDFRGLGAEVSWLSPLPWPVTFILEAQDAQGACCARTYSPADAPAVINSPADLVYTGVIEQFFPVTDDLSVLWGLNAMTGSTPYVAAGARGEIFGTDLLVRYKPVNAPSRWFVELQTEGLVRTRHDGVVPFSSALDDEGLYAQLVFHPNPEYGGGVRYDWVSNDPLHDDPASAGLGANTQRASVVAEYSPTHFSRIQVELNGGTRGQGDILWGAMINLEVAVGAHGAHAY